MTRNGVLPHTSRGQGAWWESELRQGASWLSPSRQALILRRVVWRRVFLSLAIKGLSLKKMPVLTLAFGQGDVQSCSCCPLPGSLIIYLMAVGSQCELEASIPARKQSWGGNLCCWLCEMYLWRQLRSLWMFSFLIMPGGCLSGPQPGRNWRKGVPEPGRVCEGREREVNVLGWNYIPWASRCFLLILVTSSKGSCLLIQFCRSMWEMLLCPPS